MKKCILNEEKICDNCNECNVCDLDANKICDNCGKCIEEDCEYKEILVHEILKEKDYSKNEDLI